MSTVKVVAGPALATANGTLPETGGISGQVISEHTGQSVQGATVTATKAGGGETASATTDARGGYLIRGLQPGEYEVTSSPAGPVE